MKSLDVGDEETVCQVENILRQVFNNLAMKCILEGEWEDNESDVALFITRLRKLPNLHFER